MLKQTFVKVLNKSNSELNGTESVITYKAFQYTSEQYELIGQCDEKGNLIPGNPNLHPEYRTQVQKDAGHAADTREEQITAPVIERKKPGPKPKSITLTEQTA
jgi:hypothetical protein